MLEFGVVFQAGLWKDVMNSSDETAISKEYVWRPGQFAFDMAQELPAEPLRAISFHMTEILALFKSVEVSR